MRISTFSLLVGIIFSIAGVTHAQSFWTDVNPASISVPESARMAVYPQKYRTLALDIQSLQQYLAQAPLEFTAGSRNSGVVVQLPFPDGRMESFRVVESPVMKPELAAKYPMIRTYSARSADGKPYTARFDYTEHGFHAIIRTGEGTIYIDPYAEGQTKYHFSYYTRDCDLSGMDMPVLGCGLELGHDDKGEEHQLLETRGLELMEQTTVSLRIYDLALACTGEYGQAKGGTVAAVLSTMNTAVNRINEILMIEAAIKLELIASNDLLVFLNPATDPYANGTTGYELLGQNNAVINSVVGAGSYDIGHVFTMGCTDVGGVASLGSACGQNKASGVTCHYTNNFTYIVEAVMAHELGHQFIAEHTFNNCPGGSSGPSAYEPGSGSTIMSYGGLCGNQNIFPGADAYYHVSSLQAFRNFITVGNGSLCPDIIVLDNQQPELELPYANGFFIPISTPFELNAIATDSDGDALTYCWEQYDLGPISNIGSPIGDAPLFRTFPPRVASNRTFPRLPAILGNFSDNTEVLPTYSRNLTFRCTVRDNFSGGGGVVWKEVKFKATDQAGPFLVTYPNLPGLQITGGTFDTIVWDVANTDLVPVNCKSVNIRLSVNGGQTFPYLLAASAPNTGSAVVAIPDITSSSARIRVEAADNIFFDLSNSNFQILAPTEPGFTISVQTPQYQKLCLPAEGIETLFSSASVLGFQSPLSLEIVGGLPAGSTASFSNAEIMPGESTALSFDFNNLTADQDLEILVQVSSPDGDTVLIPVYFQLIYSDFSDLATATPLNGESNLNLNEAIFTWNALPHAETYDFQLATSPSFEAGAMVNQKTGIASATYLPPVVLDKNTLYFWRIRAGNQCRQGDYLPPSAFHTVSLACDKFTSNDVPVGIPSVGTPTRTSKLTILQEGTITDMNVLNVNGYHTGIQQLSVSLQSPDGTEVKLFGEACGSVAPFFLSFDDESPFIPPCPPNTGQFYKPKEPLSAFIGKNTSGTWTLVLKVTSNFGGGGLLEGWGLEFCADFLPKHPYLVNNNTLLVQPGGQRLVMNDALLVEDQDNTAEDLTYTIVSPPKHGTLVWYDNDMDAGGKFRQISINSGNVWYEHSGDGSTEDSFSFVVEDGTGGWLGITTFTIQMDPNAPIATRELPSVQPLRLYPNPTSGLVQIELPEPVFGDLLLRVVNTQGQLLFTRQNSLELDLSGLPGGVYWVQAISDGKSFTGKVMKN